MKKSFLALALALVLCLSLAVPAFAVEASVYENDNVRITNVTDKGDLDTDYSNHHVGGAMSRHCTCVAPVTITPGAKFGDNIEWYIAVYPEDLPEDGDVSDLDWETYEGYTGSELTLTEPGGYSVGFASGSTETVCNFLITVQAASEVAPTVPTTDPTTTNPDTKPSFTDVNEGDWFYDAVTWAVEKEITNGTSETTFSPGQDCTEAQILTFLWRAKGCPEPENPVPSDTYYAKAAKWAVEQGIVDEFEADVPCTRAMTVDFLWRAAGKPQSETKIAFTDVTAGTDLESAVAWAVEAGVTTGTSETTFSPDTVCTRGHIVTFLYRNLAE